MALPFAHKFGFAHRMDDPITTLVSDLMTEDLLTIRTDAHVGRARDLMLTLGIHALPVLEGEEVVGIVTSGDLVDDWPDREVVSTAMSWNPHAIDLRASAAEAAGTMIDREVHHLIVERDGELVGVLSSMDLLEVLRDPD